MWVISQSQMVSLRFIYVVVRAMAIRQFVGLQGFSYDSFFIVKEVAVD